MNKTQLAKEIARREKRWAAASKKERRLLVVKDVIKQVAAGRIKVKKGSWVTPPENTPEGTDLWDAVLGGMKCSACALGSMLLTTTLYKDQVKVCEPSFVRAAIPDLDYGDILDGHQQDTVGFTDLFSAAELQSIEIAFEGGRGWFGPTGGVDIDVTDFPREIAFHKKHRSAKKRLLAIMRNIVRHGTFKP